jgi:hypothetical protein
MAAPTIARSGQESTTRLERGWALYSEYSSKIIASYSKGVWLVPSQSDGTSVHEVHLGRHGSDCECADFERRGVRCKHIICAQYAAKNSERCAFCGKRFAYGELAPVDRDHYLGLAYGKCS